MVLRILLSALILFQLEEFATAGQIIKERMSGNFLNDGVLLLIWSHFYKLFMRAITNYFKLVINNMLAKANP